jgi:2,3-diketo-5-methylthio-1-phosphopentane phosphatase
VAPTGSRGSTPAPERGLPGAIVCDFDGTISIDDVTDSILLRFARPGWEALESAWRAGRMGSRECMAGQVALLDCSAEELDAHVEQLPIDPHFAAFAALVAAAGVQLTIASDGLDRALHVLLRRHRLDQLPTRASRLVQAGPRRWRLEFPHAMPGCRSKAATCKCAVVAAARERGDAPVLMIGDGASDRCVAGAADLTFARKELLAYCAERDLPHEGVADFAAAIAAWQVLAAAPRATQAIL